MYANENVFKLNDILYLKQRLVGFLAPTTIGEEEVVERKVRYWKHAIRAFYLMTISVFQLAYGVPKSTMGGKLHLIGVSFLILTVTAVYMVNLSAILTNQ